MDLYLRALSKEDDKEIHEMLQGINQNDNGFHNEVGDRMKTPTD